MRNSNDAEMRQGHANAIASLKTPPVSFNAALRANYKNGRVETNIYFDSNQARFRVKVGASWLGSFYSLEGAREKRDSYKSMTTKEREIQKVNRELAEAKENRAALIETHRIAIKAFEAEELAQLLNIMGLEEKQKNLELN